jgi:N-acetylglucosamine-6-sulfatase
VNIRKICVLLVALGVTLSLKPVAWSAVRPNIVVVMIDDFDVESLQMLVQNGMMPNLKRYFLDVGYDFSEAFSTASLGGPSRATFLTGQYPHNHGVVANYPPLGGVTLLNASSTVATWLKTAGYRTGLVGRYVTGYGWWTDGSVIPPGWDDWQALVDPSSFNMHQYQINFNGAVVDIGAIAASQGVELYQTDILTFAALQAIGRAAADPRPFFLNIAPVSFNFEVPIYNECPDPNDPGPWGGSFLGVTQRPASRHMNTIFGNDLAFPLPGGRSFNEEDVSDKPAWVRANAPFTVEDVDCLKKRHWRKLETLRAVDQLIGVVMNDLEVRGLLANTVAIFTADNGFLEGQHRFPQKTPAYEDSIRVPLVIRTPWNNVPRNMNKLAINTDLAPTIAHLALATPTHAVDGRSLVPLLQNPEALPWRTIGLLAHRRDPGEGTTDGRFTGPPDYVAARTAWPTPRKYVRYPTVPDGLNGEYYDLTADPYELENRYADPARQAEIQRLEAWLTALKTCKGIACYLLETYF